MASALQIRRGPKANLAAAIVALGEPLIVTDTRELYVGTGATPGTAKVKIGDVVFADVAPVVEKEKLWIDTTLDKIYRASTDGLTWVAISGSGGSGIVAADFTVYGVTQGVYRDGDIITAGTPLEDIVRNMLQAVIPASYNTPMLSLTGGGMVVEAGTTVSPNLVPTWQQNDGGVGTLYTLKKDGTTLITNPSAQTFGDTPFVLGDLSVTYQATMAYDGGIVKNNNQGNPSPAGQIAAGTATSNNATLTGRRNLFYGADIGVAAPATSADVRFLPQKALNPVNGSTFTLNIAAGTKRVIFAYPDSLRAVSSVKYVELGNGEVKDTFALTAVSVEGADGFTAIGYKIYSYVPAVPYGDAVTYVVTI